VHLLIKLRISLPHPLLLNLRFIKGSLLLNLRFSSIGHWYTQPILAILSCLCPFIFYAPRLFDFNIVTWWMLFQKRGVWTEFDIYVLFKHYLYIVHCTRKTSCSEIIQLSCKSNIDIIYESSLTDLIINEIYPIYMCFFNLFSYT
jgi:hypothetical protein